MTVLMANRMLARRARIAGTDAHGDKTAAGFADPGPGYPGIATIGGDVAEYQPGGRTWTLAVHPALWPLEQQDLIVDVDSGEMWEVTSAQNIKHTLMPLLNYVEVQAHSYTADGTKA